MNLCGSKCVLGHLSNADSFRIHVHYMLQGSRSLMCHGELTGVPWVVLSGLFFLTLLSTNVLDRVRSHAIFARLM